MKGRKSFFYVKCVCVILALVLPGAISAQSDNVAVNSVFWGTRLVDQQTTNTVGKGAFQYEILHRFGTVEKGISNLFGIYAPSNISMGLAYGISKRAEVQFYSEKNNRTQEFGFKYIFLKQDINNSPPFTLAYYTNISVDARNKGVFGEGSEFSDRLFYNHQLLLSRQIDYKYNLQLSFSFVHFNKVGKEFQPDKCELGFSFGYKLNRKKSLFVSYQHPFDFILFANNINATEKPLDGLALGYETSTKSHVFQVFVSNRDNIVLGKELIYNQKRIAVKNILVGFNICVNINKKKGA